jgi:dipeptidase E
MKLFLTSSVHAVAHDIAKRVNLFREKELVFIETAAESEEGDKTWLANDRQSLVDAGFSVTDYTLTGKSRNELEQDLQKFDYLYLSGGNTSYLLEQSRKSGFFSLVQELVKGRGKTYIGTSAGSIIAGPKLPDYFLEEGTKPEDTNSYGFVNFTIAPHWGSEGFRDKYLGGRLEIAYRKDQVPILLLTDSQYVLVDGDRMEIVQV